MLSGCQFFVNDCDMNRMLRLLGSGQTVLSQQVGQSQGVRGPFGEVRPTNPDLTPPSIATSTSLFP